MLMYNLWSCFLSPQHMTGSRTELTFKIFCDEQNLSLPQVFKPPRMPASMPCPRSSLPSAIRAKIWLSSSPWNMNRTLTVEEATLKCLTAPWIRRTCMASPLTCSCLVRTSLLIKKKKKIIYLLLNQPRKILEHLQKRLGHYTHLVSMLMNLILEHIRVMWTFYPISTCVND